MRELTPQERTRDRYLRAQYGITLEDFEAIVAFQGGVCAICKRVRPPGSKPLHVDHDHITKRVRGAICYDCNHRVLGRQRNPELLRAAARYLERPPADEALLAT